MGVLNAPFDTKMDFTSWSTRQDAMCDGGSTGT